jgi:FkbM family methyltransferase
MRITQANLPLLSVLQARGMSFHIKGWERCIRALFPIADQTSDTISTRYYGHPYMAVPNHYVDWQVLTTGSYESHDLRVFEKLSKHLTHPIILDIGANVGHHSFFFAAIGWHVEAFEPNPELWPIIETKLAAAGFSHVRLHKVGLGDQDESLEFYLPEGHNSGTGTFVGDDAGQSATGHTLPIRQGDAFLISQGVRKIDLMKIDIQGFEPQALRGLKTTLVRDRPIVCIEIGNENRQAMPTLDALASLLPERYIFRAIRRQEILIYRRSRIAELVPQAFKQFDGNLFCLPEERRTWIDDDV